MGGVGLHDNRIHCLAHAQPVGRLRKIIVALDRYTRWALQVDFVLLFPTFNFASFAAPTFIHCSYLHVHTLLPREVRLRAAVAEAVALLAGRAPVESLLQRHVVPAGRSVGRQVG